MGRIYFVPYNGTLTAAGGDADLINLQPADDKPIRLRGWILSQSTEVGDAAEESPRITVRKFFGGTITIGTGGAGTITALPPPADSAEPVWSFTARANDTTVTTIAGGTNQICLDTAWNERNTPFDFWYPSVEFCPQARQGEALAIRLESTLADDIGASLTFIVEEL